MESNEGRPTPAEAAAVLDEAEGSRGDLAQAVELPPRTLLWIGAAVAVSIAAFAVGFTEDHGWSPVVAAAGAVLFIIVATVELVRFRRLNGVWLGGYASRVVLGTSTAATISYAAALVGAFGAAVHGLWWLVGIAAVAGGAAYAVSGRRWMAAYRKDPVPHARESLLWLVAVVVLAVAGLVLLVVGR